MDICWVNGNLIPLKDSAIEAGDRGFTLADGVFETLYSGKNGIENFEYHTMRLRSAAAIMVMQVYLADAFLKEAINSVLKANNLSLAAIRITVTRGPGKRGLNLPETPNATVCITAHPASRNVDMARMAVTEYTRNDTSPLCGYKTLNYTESVMAMYEAQSKGYNDGILCNTKGKVVCATTSNIFLIKDAVLYTPGLDQGCLMGITRMLVLLLAKNNNITVKECSVTLDMLKTADAGFLTNSIVGVRPIEVIDNTTYDLHNPLLHTILKLYNKK